MELNGWCIRRHPIDSQSQVIPSALLPLLRMCNESELLLMFWNPSAIVGLDIRTALLIEAQC